MMLVHSVLVNRKESWKRVRTKIAIIATYENLRFKVDFEER